MQPNPLLEGLSDHALGGAMWGQEGRVQVELRNFAAGKCKQLYVVLSLICGLRIQLSVQSCRERTSLEK